MSNLTYSGKNLPSQTDSQFQEILKRVQQRTKKQFLYTQKITRQNPAAFVFLIDQSGSMSEEVEINGKEQSKAEVLSSILNQSLNEMIDRCKKGNEVRDYFHICLIGYGGDRDNTAKIIWEKNPYQKAFLTPSELLQCYIGTETITVDSIRPDGSVRQMQKKIYQWVRPCASQLTPMNAAFLLAHDLLVQWIDKYPQSYPPTVIHITDGAATDSTEKQLLQSSQKLRSLATEDGETILFNIHITNSTENPIYFPCKKEDLTHGDQYTHLMFDLSSDLPPIYNTGIAHFTQKDIKGSYTALVVNAPMSQLISLLNIGTNTNQPDKNL